MAFADFYDEVMAVVAAASGTTLSNTSGNPRTCFSSVEAARLSIVQYVEEGLKGGMGRPSPPFVAVQIGAKNFDSEWGVAGNTYRYPVTVGVIDAMGNPTTAPNQKTIHALAELIAAAIDDAGDLFETFQSPPERADIDSSEANTIFSHIAGDSKVQIVAATVTWMPGLLVQG